MDWIKAELLLRIAGIIITVIRAASETAISSM